MRKLILSISLVTAFCFQSQAKTDYSFAVKVVGHGSPMILIPGIKGSADTYKSLIAHYKDHYTCYAITLAGFAGQPASGAHDHLLLQQRDEIIRYITENHLKKPVIVGFSFGGKLATWITTTRPDLTGALIDIDGTPFDMALQDNTINIDSLIKTNGAKYTALVDKPQDFWRDRLYNAYHVPEEVERGNKTLWRIVSDTAHFNEITVWDFESDYRSATLMRIEGDTLDMRNAVSRIHSPVLVLGSWVSWGYDSPKEAAKDYRKLWNGAKGVTIAFSSKGKHFLMYDDPKWLLLQIDRFLQAIKT